MRSFVFTFVHICNVNLDPTLIDAWSAQATLFWSMSVACYWAVDRALDLFFFGFGFH